MTPLEIQMRKQLGRYLLREISLRDLRHWLVKNAWDCTDGSPEEQLMGEIERLGAQFSDGRMDGEDDLRARLLPLLNEIDMSGERVISSGYTSTTDQTQVTTFEYGCRRYEVASV